MLFSPDLRRMLLMNSCSCAQMATSEMPMERSTGTSMRRAESRSALE